MSVSSTKFKVHQESRQTRKQSHILRSSLSQKVMFKVHSMSLSFGTDSTANSLTSQLYFSKLPLCL